MLQKLFKGVNFSRAETNVWCIKNRTKLSNFLLLSLVWILLHQTLYIFFYIPLIWIVIISNHNNHITIIMKKHPRRKRPKMRYSQGVLLLFWRHLKRLPAMASSGSIWMFISCMIKMKKKSIYMKKREYRKIGALTKLFVSYLFGKGG